MSVGFDVETFLKATGRLGSVDDPKKETEKWIGLVDEKYDDFISALKWGDRRIVAEEGANFVSVVVGACLALGIPFDEVWAVVQKSNMSRLDEDGKALLSPDGKVLRGPNYKGPEAEIERLVKQS
jgi:predicted HAD superfamily Cof-like phosphohydrolase